MRGCKQRQDQVVRLARSGDEGAVGHGEAPADTMRRSARWRPLFGLEADDEAISIADDSPFLRASYFYVQVLRQIFRGVEAYANGMVTLRVWLIPAAAGGNSKVSGVGHEGTLWNWGLRYPTPFGYISGADCPSGVPIWSTRRHSPARAARTWLPIGQVKTRTARR